MRFQAVGCRDGQSVARNLGAGLFVAIPSLCSERKQANMMRFELIIAQDGQKPSTCCTLQMRRRLNAHSFLVSIIFNGVKLRISVCAGRSG